MLGVLATLAASPAAGGDAPPGDGLVYTAVDPCIVMRTKGSLAGTMAADEVRPFLVRDADFSDQGGSPVGCGVPETALAVALELRVVVEQGAAGHLKAWAADAVEPANRLLDYQPVPGQTLFDASAVVALCPPGECTEGEMLVLTGERGAEVRADVVGFFRPPTGADVGGPGSGLDADTLDGLDAVAFSPVAHTHAGEEIVAPTLAEPRLAPEIARDAEVVPLVLAGDGPGSGLDADLLDGVDSAALRGRPSNVVTVSAFGAQFTSIQAAIDSIGDAGPDNRYLVRIGPGVYDGAVTLADPFIALEGVGAGVTVTRPTLTVSAATEVRSLAVDGLDGPGPVAQLSGGARLRGVEVRARGAATAVAVTGTFAGAEIFAGRALAEATAVSYAGGGTLLIRDGDLAGAQSLATDGTGSVALVNTRLDGALTGATPIDCIGSFDGDFVELEECP